MVALVRVGLCRNSSCQKAILTQTVTLAVEGSWGAKLLRESWRQKSYLALGESPGGQWLNLAGTRRNQVPGPQKLTDIPFRTHVSFILAWTLCGVLCRGSRSQFSTAFSLYRPMHYRASE